MKTTNNLFFIFLFIAAVLFSFNVNGQSIPPSLVSQWKQKQFRQVLPELISFFDNHPEQRSPQLYYMIASSFCSIDNPSFKERGCNVWFPRIYDLEDFNPDDTETLTNINSLLCDQSSVIENNNQTIIVIKDYSASVASVGGDCKSYLIDNTKPISVRPIVKIRDLPSSAYESRLFLNYSPPNIYEVRNYYNCHNMIITNNFILMSYGEHTESMLYEMVSKIDFAYQFMLSEYSFLSLNKFFTIHIIPPEQELMNDFYIKFYGIKLPYGTIGYSQIKDLSISALIRNNSTSTGTIIHEMMHLLLELNYADIPVWFEEGLACLYEETTIENNKLLGRHGWRGEVLNRLDSYTPSIRELLRMNNNSFNLADEYTESEDQREYFSNSGYKRAANHAKTRYLMLYLQEKGKLSEFYYQLRDFDPEKFTSDPGQDYEQILTSILNKDIEEIEEDFEEWFRQLR